MKKLLVAAMDPRSLCGVMTALVGLLSASADPILPYTQPVAAQLSNDVAALQAIPDRTPEENKRLATGNSALRSYRRTSRNFTTDISILRSLDSLLARSPGYPALLADAVTGYINDFYSREEELRTSVLTAPRSMIRSNALAQLNSITNKLAHASTAATTTKAIPFVQAAAQKLPVASNNVVHALTARVRLSSMGASIGRLSFISTPGTTHGTFLNGTLELTAFDQGIVVRNLDFHIEDVGTNTPATYFLGVGKNTATYTASDPKRGEFHFVSIPGSESNPSSLTVDSITPLYMIGHFHFTGQAIDPVPGNDTNTIAAVTNGEFQLNF